MQVTVEQVEYLAQLARLRLRPEEMARMASDLSRILGYMRLLDEAATGDVPPLEQLPIGIGQLRPDTVKGGLERERALALAPKTRAGFFSVPKVR